MDAINYPKVVYRKDQKVYLDLKLDGKRMRLFNGKKFNIELYPNSFPKDQRLNQANILAAQIYAKLLSGASPMIKNQVGLLSNQTDLYYIKEALNSKLKEDFSKNYKDGLKLAYHKIEAHSKSGEVTPDNIAAALDVYSNNTYFNTIRRNMNTLCGKAVKLGMHENPVKDIRRKKEKATLHKAINNTTELLQEIKRFNANLYLCCLLTYGCLLRPHREIRELSWEDFSDDLSYIRLSGDRNKSGRNRIVPVPFYVKEVLKKTDDHLNIFSGTKEPYGAYYFKTLWKRFAKQSKLLEENQTLYSFRHTGAIDIYKRTGSIEKLRTAMGHSSIIVSLTYLRGLEIIELEESDMPRLITKQHLE